MKIPIYVLTCFSVPNKGTETRTWEIKSNFEMISYEITLPAQTHEQIDLLKLFLENCCFHFCLLFLCLLFFYFLLYDFMSNIVLSLKVACLHKHTICKNIPMLGFLFFFFSFPWPFSFPSLVDRKMCPPKDVHILNPPNLHVTLHDKKDFERVIN